MAKDKEEEVKFDAPKIAQIKQKNVVAFVKYIRENGGNETDKISVVEYSDISAKAAIAASLIDAFDVDEADPSYILWVSRCVHNAVNDAISLSKN
jgi:hypothetical protein